MKMQMQRLMRQVSLYFPISPFFSFVVKLTQNNEIKLNENAIKKFLIKFTKIL